MSSDDARRSEGLDIGRCCLGHTAVAPVFGRLKGFKPYVLAVIGDTGHGKTTFSVPLPVAMVNAGLRQLALGLS